MSVEKQKALEMKIEDPTADKAIENADTDRMAKKVIKQCLRYLKGHGFELVERFHLYHKKTGREYK